MGQRIGRSSCSQDDIRYLKKKTGWSKKEIKKRYKSFMEQCPSGKLTPTEFAAQYNIISMGSDVESFCTHVFRTFDKENRGTLSFREFMDSISLWSNGTKEDKLEWTFTLYDINRNGKIERYEVEQITEAAYKLLRKQLDDDYDPSTHVEEFFENMDLDKDGVISREEFFRACSELPSLVNLPVPVIHNVSEIMPTKKKKRKSQVTSGEQNAN